MLTPLSFFIHHQTCAFVWTNPVVVIFILFFMFDFRMSESCRVVYLMLFVSSNTPFYTFILFAVWQLCTLWWQLLLKIVFVSTAGIDESVVTFETLCFDVELFCSYFFYFGYISLMCLLAVCVIVHGCVKVYERWSFIYVAIYLNKKNQNWKLFLCLDVFFPTY